MKLSTRSTYGMRALVEVALAHGQGPVSASRLAERHGLPVAYLEQLLHQLKRRGVLKSVRGPRGGYVLTRDPRHITMADVVQILDGNEWNSMARVPSMRWRPTAGHRRGTAVSKKRASKSQAVVAISPHAQWIAQAVWRCVHEGVLHTLSAVTLQDLCQEQQAIAREPLEHRYVFHI